MSPMAQVTPIQLVSGMAMVMSIVLHICQVWSIVMALFIMYMSFLMSGVPWPRRRSLKKAVLLVPSVMLARLMQLRL